MNCELIDLQYVKTVKYEASVENSYTDVEEVESGQRYPVIKVESLTTLVPHLHPIGCIAVFVIGEEIVVGYSICSEGDQFEKKIAKRVAEARAMANYNLGKFRMDENDFKKFPTEVRQDAILIQMSLLGAI